MGEELLIDYGQQYWDDYLELNKCEEEIQLSKFYAKKQGRDEATMEIRKVIKTLKLSAPDADHSLLCKLETELDTIQDGQQFEFTPIGEGRSQPSASNTSNHYVDAGENAGPVQNTADGDESDKQSDKESPAETIIERHHDDMSEVEAGHNKIMAFRPARAVNAVTGAGLGSTDSCGAKVITPNDEE